MVLIRRERCKINVSRVNILRRLTMAATSKSLGDFHYSSSS